MSRVYLTSDSEGDLESVGGLLETKGLKAYENKQGWRTRKVLGGLNYSSYFLTIEVPNEESWGDFIKILEDVLLPLGLGYSLGYEGKNKNLSVVRLFSKENN